MPIKPDRWTEYSKEMKKQSRPFSNFVRAISNPNTLVDYVYWMNLFMRYCAEKNHVKDSDDFESLLSLDANAITDIMLDYIDYLVEKGNKGSTIQSKMVSPCSFLEMNRKIFHKSLIQKSIPRDNVEKGGKYAITIDDLKNLLASADTPRQKAIVHFLASTGIRPQGLTDPVLRMKHLISIPHLSDPQKTDYCYAIRVYDESPEGYWAFLTPEARKSLLTAMTC